LRRLSDAEKWTSGRGQLAAEIILAVIIRVGG
jgi:hypothetical protein